MASRLRVLTVSINIFFDWKNAMYLKLFEVIAQVNDSHNVTDIFIET